MKTIVQSIFVTSILLTVLLSGCGSYYFPYVVDDLDSGEIIYLANWENRTSKLGMNAKLYQSLSRWFQKSATVSTTKKRTSATYILKGEIIYIDLPSISWDGSSTAQDIKVRLAVRYVLQDLKSGEILWEVPKEIWTEDYDATSNNATVENEALDIIIDDISEAIYLGSLARFRKKHEKTASQASTGSM